VTVRAASAAAAALAAAGLAAVPGAPPAPGVGTARVPNATAVGDAQSPNGPAVGAARVPDAPAAGAGALRARDAAGRWRTWWRPGRAPARWPAPDPALAGLVAWRPAADGVEAGELALSGDGEAWRVRVVLVRIDPARQRLALDARVDGGGQVRPWGVDAAPAGATVALNAGMFDERGPWGWVVHGGRELQAPGAGALASAVVVGADGRVRVLEADSLPAARAAAARGEVAEAVQSYPTLLAATGGARRAAARRGAGAAPAGAAPVDLEHRDARLAVGELRDGRVLVALTRFDGLAARWPACRSASPSPRPRRSWARSARGAPCCSTAASRPSCSCARRARRRACGAGCGACRSGSSPGRAAPAGGPAPGVRRSARRAPAPQAYFASPIRRSSSSERLRLTLSARPPRSCTT
jgi:hypothetical protein